MVAQSEESPSQRERRKREQKYLHFALKPGDVEHLDRLSDAQRNVLLSEGSYEERAASLNIPVGTVRSRLHRARAALEALRAASQRGEAAELPN